MHTHPRATSGLRAVRVATLDDLAALPRAWRDAALPTPFGSLEAACTWLRLEAARARPFILAVADATGDLVAVAPWCIVREGDLDVVTGIGGEDAWYHEPLLFRPDAARQAWDCLASALFGAGRSWNLLRLVVREQEHPALRRALARRGPVYERRVEWRQNPLIALDDWEAFMAGRPKQFKEILRRRGRKLERLEHRYILADASSIDRLLDELLRLHADRWAGERPSWDPYHQTVRAACRRALGRDELFLLALEIEGRPAALNLWFRDGDRASCLLLVYEPDFASLSAGTLCTARAIEVLHAAGVRRLDCGPGASDWKDFLKTGHVPTLEIVAGSPFSLRGGVLACWQGAIKPWLKQWKFPGTMTAT